MQSRQFVTRLHPSFQWFFIPFNIEDIFCRKKYGRIACLASILFQEIYRDEEPFIITQTVPNRNAGICFCSFFYVPIFWRASSFIVLFYKKHKPPSPSWHCIPVYIIFINISALSFELSNFWALNIKELKFYAIQKLYTYTVIWTICSFYYTLMLLLFYVDQNVFLDIGKWFSPPPWV